MNTTNQKRRDKISLTDALQGEDLPNKKEGLQYLVC